MADFDLKQIVAARLGENYALHEQFINPTLVKVFRTIGFDKVYARAKGQYLWDKEGNRYLDLLSGFGVFSIGRNHPAVAQAIRDVLELDLANMVQMDCAFLAGVLAEALVKRCPPHLDAVFFCNSGTEAVEASLKFARAATGRSKFAYLDHGWHGLTLGSLSIMGNDEFREGFGDLLPGVQVPHGDLAALEQALAKRDIACLAVECIQGKGVRIPADDYLPAAQELCRKYGTLLFCDEVQTGYGRTGKMFSFQHWNLEPDIVATSKALSGGYVPVGAMITRRWIYQKLYSRMDRCWVHSTSFGRNNLGMAVGLATLHILDQENLVERSAVQGQKLLEAVNALRAKHEVLKEARGKGCLIGIEFHEPKSLKLKMAWKMVHAAHDGLFAQMIVMPLLAKHRVLTQVSGNHGDIIRVLPPFVINDEDIRHFVAALDDVLSDCHRLPGPMWDLGANLVKAALANKGQQVPVAAATR
ncbi:aspartate aminotransferase family protein [bacterium]|nr:aspartate aminotransferase family protein [bacterium]